MATTKEKIISSITVVAVFLVVVFFAGWLLKTVVLQSQKVPTATLPPDDQVPTLSPSPVANIQNASLLSSGPYTPSQDVYKDPSVYDKESIRVALNGEFDVARLVVEGNVNEEGPHFVSINFSTESGVLNAVRNSQNSLDLEQTKSRGGVFTKDSGIKFSIDLLGQTALATSNNEFLATKQLTKTITFWDYLKQPPPTVARVLIAPFNEYGRYGGATITEINFEYTCKNGSKCGVALCNSNENGLESRCILRNFGNNAESLYRKSVGL